MRHFIFILSLFLSISGAVRADGIEALHARSAGAEMAMLQRDVELLRDLAQSHIDTVGLVQALNDFMASPWSRDANGLHIWGVTKTGISWFDAGHPEVVGLDVSQMSDLEGRMWANLATQSAAKNSVFTLLFPHPRTGQAAQGVHSCFMLADGQRVLCAGAFEDIN